MISKNTLEVQISLGFGDKIRTPELKKRGLLLKNVQKRRRSKKLTELQTIQTVSEASA